MHQNRRGRLLLGEDKNALTWLVIINAVIFIMLNFVKVIYKFSYEDPIAASNLFHTQIADWFIMPAKAQAFFTRPWTLITYMFSHESVLYMISSLLWLWSFGYILQDLAGNDKLVPIYLYGGVAGGVAYLLAANLIPGIALHETILTSASPSIMAVAIATTALAPRYKIFPMINGGIPLWILTLVFVTVDYASIAGSSIGYAIAHLAAAGMGLLFVQQLKNGHDWGRWMLDLLNWTDDLFNPEKKHKKPVASQHFYKATKKPFEISHNFTQEKLDEVLDKINQKGYHFLTEEEKDFLKRASEQDL
jgi:membrane associated rhomboid family serine protease